MPLTQMLLGGPPASQGKTAHVGTESPGFEFLLLVLPAWDLGCVTWPAPASVALLLGDGSTAIGPWCGCTERRRGKTSKTHLVLKCLSSLCSQHGPLGLEFLHFSAEASTAPFSGVVT